MLATILLAIGTLPAAADGKSAIAMFGEPALAEGFPAFPYVNADAPKGGTLRQAVVGSFDSLNPFIVKGQAPTNVLRGFVFESLMARSKDEPFTLYGLLAQSLDVPDDRSSVTFHINPAARFSDGSPVTAKDVVFSMETLRDHGRPNFRNYYSRITGTETPDDLTVSFRLAGGDRELVLIIGLMPIIPRAQWEGRDFEATTLETMLASGPYVITGVKPGEQIILTRNPDYWGRDLPVNKGLWNFDTLQLDYYRDSTTAFEAFKKGLADIREESDPTRWSGEYKFPGADGLITATVPNAMPAPASALVFNTRRPIFADIRVRQALLYAFDFEWANANLFNGLFQRTQGYFAGSELSAIGQPVSEKEKAILDPWINRLPPGLIDGTYRLPVSDGSGHDRKALRVAVDLLKSAGWEIRDGGLVNSVSGQPFAFDMTVNSPEQERIALHFQRSLAQIGITMNIRQTDSAQYQRRLQSYDYDMIPATWYNSLSPGNEQAFYWGSDGRTTSGTRNYPGVSDPAIDAAVKALTASQSRDDLIAAARTIDRMLLAGVYTIPLYDTGGQWLARWRRIACPEKVPLMGFELTACWAAPQ